MKKRLSLLALALDSGLAWAGPDGPAPVLSEWPGVKDLAWAGVALILVLAALVMLLKAIQRLGRFKAGRGGMFEMRGYHPLDNRKYLAAVAVDGRLLIIGVTPERLVPLGQWPLRDAVFPPPDGPDLKSPAAEDAPPDISIAGSEEPRP